MLQQIKENAYYSVPEGAQIKVIVIIFVFQNLLNFVRLQSLNSATKPKSVR